MYPKCGREDFVGRRCRGGFEFQVSTMFFIEVKYGSPGSICSCCRVCFPCACPPAHVCNRSKCPVAAVGPPGDEHACKKCCRLNVHLSPVAKERQFQMPANMTARPSSTSTLGRLSSFGFSGTIAHAAFTSFWHTGYILWLSEAASRYRE